MLGYRRKAWTKPITATPEVIDSPLAAFLGVRYPEGVKLPVKVLFQLRLTDGRCNVVFEDSDRSRWKVSPANYDAVQQELRPVFD